MKIMLSLALGLAIGFMITSKPCLLRVRCVRTLRGMRGLPVERNINGILRKHRENIILEMSLCVYTG